jgi:hypothetical protein
VVPDPKTQFKVLFQAMRIVPSTAVLEAIKTRKEEALRIGLMPYDALPSSEVDEEEESAASPAGKKTTTKY